MELPIVATYPLAKRRCETHRCVFQGRKMREVATNIYLRKMLEKPKSGSTIFKSKRFDSCFYARGRYQHPTRPSQGTAAFNQMCKIMTLFFFFLFYVFYLLGSTKAGFCSYVSSIAMRNSDLHSSLESKKVMRSVDFRLLNGSFSPIKVKRDR